MQGVGGGVPSGNGKGKHDPAEGATSAFKMEREAQRKADAGGCPPPSVPVRPAPPPRTHAQTHARTRVEGGGGGFWGGRGVLSGLLC